MPCIRGLSRLQWPVLWRLGILLVMAFAVAGCGPSLEDSVERLGDRDPAVREQARQELLLAKDRAIEPLLAALDDDDLAASRPELIGVLASLLRRLGDTRLEAALIDHLASDADARVRAACARHLGLNKRHGAAEALLAALDDEAAEVRHQALVALGALEERLDESQAQRLRQAARRLATDAHQGVRLEAAIRVENFVDAWIEEAQNRQLGAQMAAAESLYHRSLEYAPASKRANYRLARFWMENGRDAEGVALLQAHGMVLEVAAVETPPVIDGVLDDPVWRQTARVDSFFLYSSAHFAAVPSKIRTRVHVAYDDEALYIGFYGYDDHPDSLVARTADFDGSLWYEDIVEIFLDPEFDHRGYVHMGVNSLGTASDAAYTDGLEQRPDTREPKAWNARATVEAYVGADFWSAECRFAFGQTELPRPRPGDRWGLNFVRTYRGAEYSQWVRTYDGGHSPDDFGLMIFR